uniref:Peptidase M12B domain-containing protein n=1 Tax=Gadus morhua TaxID=8049 RepID=A0A8C5FWD6_GADMO
MLHSPISIQHTTYGSTLPRIANIPHPHHCLLFLPLLHLSPRVVFVPQFQKQGKDMDKVKQRLAEIANHVDKFYRALNIRVALVGLEVWSDADKCPVSQDPFTTLHEFLDWRKAKLLPQRPHDNAQLISGVYFQGTTIGMAPIMSMCTAEQSGGIDHSDNPLGAAVTLAHELGHNFGMNHDTPERGCGCRVTADRGGCIMTPSTGHTFFRYMVYENTCSLKKYVL